MEAELTNFELDPTYTFHDKVITSLAEFNYNLTTCQIPREKGKPKQFRSFLTESFLTSTRRRC
jgi:hypothetical protein